MQSLILNQIFFSLLFVSLVLFFILWINLFHIQFYWNKHEKSSRSPGLSCKLWTPKRLKVHCCGLGQAEQQDELGAHMATCLYWSVLWYRSRRLCWLSVVFGLCACRNIFYTMRIAQRMVILFPVLLSHIYFRFFLILLVPFDVSSHLWGW